MNTLQETESRPSRGRDIYMLKLAYQYAEKHSTDPRTQNGVVILIPDNDGAEENHIFGANHFPKGVKEKPERWVSPLKYSYVEHAERNAIYRAAERGIRLRGTTMYAAWASCTDCARAIIQAGITTLVTHDTPIHDNMNQAWNDSIKIALEMLDEAGVEVRYVKEPIGGIKIRFNGEIVEP